MISFSPGGRRQRRWLLLALLVLAGMIFLFRWEEPAPVEWVSVPPPRRAARVAFLGRWAQPLRNVRDWVKSRVTGPATCIVIKTEIRELVEPPSLINGPMPGALFTNRTGMRAWIFSSNDWSALSTSRREAGKRLSNPSVWAANGHQAQLFTGGTVMVGGVPQSVGTWLDAVPHARDRAVDLELFFTRTDVETNLAVIHTNLAFGARLQIPPGGRALLRTGRDTDGKVFEVNISAEVRKPGR